MRKLISTIATLTLTSTTAMPLLACSPDNSLKIAFVPSKDSVEVMKIVKPLESKLKDAIHALDPTFKRNVKIITTTDYEAAGQALQDGKTSLAFLPMGTYLKYAGTSEKNIFPNAAPLVIAKRAAMEPEVKNETNKDMEITNDKAVKVINTYNNIAQKVKTKEDAHNYLYSKSETATFYRAEVLANNDFLKEHQTDADGLKDPSTYVESLKNLISAAKSEGTTKIRLLKSNTSSAGVIYPLQWMYDLGLKEEAKNIYQLFSTTTSYTNAVEVVKNRDADIVFGYTDIRADTPDDKGQVGKSYENTTVIGVTKGIPNDGIEYSKKALSDSKLINNIRVAFKTLIKDSDNKSIFDVYSHTDYDIPDTTDPSEILKWEQDTNTIYKNAQKQVQDALRLTQNS